MTSPIKPSPVKLSRIHHVAYRCRDAEETRAFYEDFLGLPLVQAFDISETKTGRSTHTLAEIDAELADWLHLVAAGVWVGGLVALAYGIVRSDTLGWTSAGVIAPIASAVVTPICSTSRSRAA